MSATKYVIDRDTLVNVGNAIRTKKGTSAQIPVPNLASEIMSIESGLFRDNIVIPDTHNTGCTNYSILTKYNHTTSPTYGIVWRVDTGSNALKLDCNNGRYAQNILEETVVFENYDFTDYDSVETTNRWSSDASRVPNGCVVVFKNCLFRGISAPYPIEFPFEDVHFEFLNCTLMNASFNNAKYENCLIGGEKFYTSKGFSNFNCESHAWKDTFYKNCYFYDNEAPRQTSESNHLDVFQAQSSGNNVHFDNCRLEGIDMGYPSAGDWSYSMFWERSLSNSSIKNCIINGGGVYSIFILKASGQTFANNLVGADYNIPYYPGSASKPAETLIQASDHAFEELESIYVSSVWRDGDNIKFLCTNDFATPKTLTVKDDIGTTYTFDLDAGATYGHSSTQLDWDDLPIDVEFQLLASGIEWLKFYDGDVLIRTYTNPGYPEPSGTENITANGTYNVKDKEFASVAVPQPSGTINITQNGSGIDVTNYATANVNVPQGVFPSGDLSVTGNGQYNCEEYKTVTVNVPTSEYTFESGECRRATATTISFQLSKVPTTIKSIICIAKTMSDLSAPSQNGGIIWTEEMGSNWCIYGDSGTGGSQGRFMIGEVGLVSVSGSTITVSGVYSYRPFPDTDFCWKVVYK